jgi:hypothetical protein
VLVIGIGAGVGIGAGIWAPSRHGPSSTLTSTSTGSALFVIDADSGSATKVAANSWRVALADPTVLWFYDRPQRGSGFESPAVFVDSWAGTFHGSVPYGAILDPSGPSGHHPTAIGVRSPQYSASGRVMSFTVTPDRGESARDALWFAAFTSSRSKSDGRVVVFVDNGNLVCPSGASGSGAVVCSPEGIGFVDQYMTNGQGQIHEAQQCLGAGSTDCITGGQCPQSMVIDLGINPPMCVTSLFDPASGKEVTPT